MHAIGGTTSSEGRTALVRSRKFGLPNVAVGFNRIELPMAGRASCVRFTPNSDRKLRGFASVAANRVIRCGAKAERLFAVFDRPPMAPRRRERAQSIHGTKLLSLRRNIFGGYRGIADIDRPRACACLSNSDARRSAMMFKRPTAAPV